MKSDKTEDFDIKLWMAGGGGGRCVGGETNQRESVLQFYANEVQITFQESHTKSGQ